MSASIAVNDQGVVLGLGDFRAGVSDRAAMYRILGLLMMTSITQTFRDQGSPAGSWPALAASTLRKKGYGSGHMLLRLSNRLFSSIRPQIVGSDLVIGTGEGIPYARVHQFGSADRSGGSIGPQAKIAGRGVHVSQYTYARLRELYYTTREVAGADGKTYRVPTPKRSGNPLKKDGTAGRNKANYQGPKNQVEVEVEGHEKHQNIPARPYLVFRPDDPDRMVSALNRYIASRPLVAGGAA